MKRNLLFIFIFKLLLSGTVVFAQQDNTSDPKKLVTIPVMPDSLAGKNFCICKIVSFSPDSYNQRTDAIFAGSTEEKPLTKKDLLKKIEYELQQALVFFDSYKLVSQYAAPVDCSLLYKYLEEKHKKISHVTFLLPSYASR
jgi:hypothetical protein